MLMIAVISILYYDVNKTVFSGNRKVFVMLINIFKFFHSPLSHPLKISVVYIL